MQLRGHRPQANSPIPTNVAPHHYDAVKPIDGQVALKVASSPPRGNRLSYSDFCQERRESVNALDKIFKGSLKEEAPISGQQTKQAFAHLPFVMKKLVELNDGLNDIAECADVKRLLEEHILRRRVIDRDVAPEIIQFRLNNFCEACEWLGKIPQTIIRETCYEWLSDFLGSYHLTLGGTSNVHCAVMALENAVFSPASCLRLCARLGLLPAASRENLTERMLVTIELPDIEPPDKGNAGFRAAILTHLAESPYVPSKLDDVMSEEFRHCESLFQRQISCAMNLPNDLRFPVLLALGKALRDPGLFLVAPALQTSMRRLEDRCNIDQLAVLRENCKKPMVFKTVSYEEIESFCTMLRPVSARYVPAAVAEIFSIVPPAMYDVLLLTMVCCLPAQTRPHGVIWLAKAASSSADFDARPAVPAADLQQTVVQLRGVLNDVSNLLRRIRSEILGDEGRALLLKRLGEMAPYLAVEERVTFLDVLLNAASSPKCYSAIADCLQHVEPNVRFDLANRLLRAIGDFSAAADKEVGEICYRLAKFHSKPSADERPEFLNYVGNLGVYVVNWSIDEAKARQILLALNESLEQYGDDAALQKHLKDEVWRIEYSIGVKFPAHFVISNNF
ncbi:MAG: hypothetical protein EON54_02190 [Alcaligenaceae bacterium]|nr:MAG: hypothetical protein EON54_02190 [Alcaligenaceae bacterium]